MKRANTAYDESWKVKAARLQSIGCPAAPVARVGCVVIPCLERQPTGLYGSRDEEPGDNGPRLGKGGLAADLGIGDAPNSKVGRGKRVARIAAPGRHRRGVKQKGISNRTGAV